MKYTYKKLTGLSEGVQQNLINEAGQKLMAMRHKSLKGASELESARIMSLTIAFKGLQKAFQSIDTYTDYILAGVQEKAFERTPELKAELEDMADIINTEIHGAYLKMVPYVLTDKEIQAVIDEGLTEKQEYEEVLDALEDILDQLSNDPTEGAEDNESDGDERVITKESLEKELDKAIEESKQQLRDKINAGDINILDILNILSPSK